jgi:hypothetical protein
MILLACGAAVLDEHARLACLETNTPYCHATAIGAAACRHVLVFLPSLHHLLGARRERMAFSSEITSKDVPITIYERERG